MIFQRHQKVLLWSKRLYDGFITVLCIVSFRNFIKHSKNTVKADYYRRAVEGAEKMDKQPEYNVTFSIPLKEGNYVI